MFFFFTVLSASNFNTPNDLGIVPQNITYRNVDGLAKTATLALGFHNAGDVVKGNTVSLTFTPATNTNNAIYVSFTVKENLVEPNNTLFIPITNIGEEDNFQWDTRYELRHYENSADPSRGGLTYLYITLNSPPPPLIFDFILHGWTHYTVTCSLTTPAEADEAISVSFGDDFVKAGVTINGTIAAGSTSFSTDIDISNDPITDKFWRGVNHTIYSNGFTCYPKEFCPFDTTGLVASSKLTRADPTKPNGAIDTIVLTLQHEYLPAAFPDDATNTLGLLLLTPHGKEDYIMFYLNEGKKFKWTPAAGSLAVEYRYNHCKIPARSEVWAHLTINQDLRYENLPLFLEEGERSVACVMAALFAVLVIVF
ncbi:hypothetical protein BLNAU_20557 [Blattamonas nauphoetae]|uniref:Uncharacterized protein n=1 Tax=Blattamonas nauphoetae TaxID=2049346 RepID=A0ABQ9WYW1_9EUKA|nr:hypothetical protein BLNAU_20557 [Blattamonas nauphoetae]